METSTIRTRIKNLLRSPAVKLRRNHRDMLSLEQVLGVSTSGSSGLTCDPGSGTVAYPAGCVVVLLNPKTNQQQHIINTSRKSITTLAFSSDGKYLVTGEGGHLPAVRVWDVAAGAQVAELQEHKYGVACVAFSPNGRHIVSVGSQHDMSVNVWAWKRNLLVAANKASSRVTAVAFSEDGSYFVTAGNRHVRFWYLDPYDSSKTSTAHALSASEESIFCACADGTLRVFSSSDLRFLRTLPPPHHLSADVATVPPTSNVSTRNPDARYPDVCAVTYDPVNLWLSCSYNDHSLYVWDVRDLQRVGRVHRALYHAGGVWDVQMDQNATEGSPGELCSSGRFFTCSADNTIRTWSTDTHSSSNGSILGDDLYKMIYTESNAACLWDGERTAGGSTEKPDVHAAESRSGVRSICISPDGKHLASGDRNGTLRVHDLACMEELVKAEVHDSEILCLEYSKPDTGLKLLVTAGRDRLIHVLDVEEGYSLLQTLDEHSSSITAVRFAVQRHATRLIGDTESPSNEGKVRLISCGADKSVYFRTAHRTFRGIKFKRTHHVVRKSALYDMDVDPTRKYAAVACQDRSIRVLNISSGKQKKCLKGSSAEDGSLLRVQIDPSGLYVATSCSDKNINLFDFRTGECLAAVFGHSETVTGIKFTDDCRHLISVSGDSCIFIWRLAPELTMKMMERLDQFRRRRSSSAFTHSVFSLELPSTLSLPTCSTDSDEAEDNEDHELFGDVRTPEGNDSHQKSLGDEQGGPDETHDWDSIKPQESRTGSCGSEPSQLQGPHKRKRWNCRIGSLDLTVKSMLELRQLDSFSRPNSPTRGCSTGHLSNQTCGSTASLKTSRSLQTRPHSAWLAPASAPEPEGVVLYPVLCPGTDSQSEAYRAQDSPSRVSGGSVGYGSGGSSPERGHGDSETSSTDEDHYTRAFHQPQSFDQERILKQQKGPKSRPRSSISSSFFARGSTISPSRSPSQTGRRSEGDLSGAFKPRYVTVHPLQEDKGQEKGFEDGTDMHLPHLSGSTPKKRSARVTEVNPKSRWRVKSVSTHNLIAESSPKSVTSSYLRRESYPPLPELSTGKSDPKIQPRHSDSPSPHPWDSPNTRRHLKNRSYMNPTTSFRAKVSRCVSLGEGFHLNLSTGQATPGAGSSRSPSSPLPAPCNQDEPGVTSLGRKPLPGKILKTHGSRTSAPSSPEPVPDSPEAHTKQHPLVDVQACSALRESRADRAQTQVNMDTCRQAAAELHSSMKKATQLIRMVNFDAGGKGTEQQEMCRVLMDALFTVRSELEAVPGLGPEAEPAAPGEGGEKTLALLEQYSQLLLQSVKKKLEDKI